MTLSCVVVWALRGSDVFMHVLATSRFGPGHVGAIARARPFPSHSVVEAPRLSMERRQTPRHYGGRALFRSRPLPPSREDRGWTLFESVMMSSKSGDWNRWALSAPFQRASSLVGRRRCARVPASAACPRRGDGIELQDALPPCALAGFACEHCATASLSGFPASGLTSAARSERPQLCNQPSSHDVGTLSLWATDAEDVQRPRSSCGMSRASSESHETRSSTFEEFWPGAYRPPLLQSLAKAWARCDASHVDPRVSSARLTTKSRTAPMDCFFLALAQLASCSRPPACAQGLIAILGLCATSDIARCNCASRSPSAQ